MQIEVVEIRDLTLISDLCVVWNSSVRATHDFLMGEDILQIERYVPTALKGVPDLVVARGSLGEPIGFMGVNDCTLEMLFVQIPPGEWESASVFLNMESKGWVCAS